MTVRALLVGTRACAHHQQVEPSALQWRPDRREQTQEERIVELAGLRGQHQADGLAAAALQATGELVGTVVDPLGLSQHACTRVG